MTYYTESYTKIFTDFSCTQSEWYSLFHTDKINFMYQLREHLFEMKLSADNVDVTYGSLDRARCDENDDEEYSSALIKQIIQTVTGFNTNVKFRSWKGTVGYILIEFPEQKSSMPNIVVDEDVYGGSSNKIYIDIIDTIFKVIWFKWKIDNKKTFYKGTTLNHKWDFYVYLGNYELRNKKLMPESFHYYKKKDRRTEFHDTQIHYHYYQDEQKLTI